MVRFGERERRPACSPTVAVTFGLTLGREALSVPVMRRALGAVLHALGTDEEAASDILVAVTEVCTNVLRHAGPDVTGYAVQVSVGLASCDVEVTELAADRRGNVPLSHRLTARLGDRRWSDRRVSGRRPPRTIPIRPGLRLARRTEHGLPRAFGAAAPAQASTAAEQGAGQANAAAQERGLAQECGVPADGAAASDGAAATAETAPAEGGRGLNLMRALVDGVTFRNSPGGGSVVTLHKRMQFPDDAPLARLRDAG